MVVSGFSPDLVSDIEFTYRDLTILVNALTNAKIHAEEHLSRNIISDDSRKAALSHLKSFYELLDYIESYLEDSGIPLSEVKEYD